MQNKNTDLKKYVNRYQCPGCVCGSNTNCGSFEKATGDNQACNRHVPGTIIIAGNGPKTVVIGMPKGFDQVNSKAPEGVSRFRLFDSLDQAGYDLTFNLAIWAMEHEDCLLVRCVQPRRDVMFIDIIPGGKIADLPKIALTIDVANFIESID